jgi:RNA polymerase sigma factor (sigma-70 family)
LAGLRDHVVVRMADVAECYRKHGEALIRFAATQVGAADAEDVVSAAVINVLAHTGEVHDMRTYLYRCVANAATRHWRGNDRRQRREQRFLLLAGGDGGAVEGTVDERTERILDALSGLSAQQRAVVHLAYWEDLTPAMIAERLGIAEGTVRHHLARARQRIRSVS